MPPLVMARVVVMAGGDGSVLGHVERLLDEGASVVLVAPSDELGMVLSAISDRHDRARLATVSGDPSADEARAAALELAREIHGADAPEVMDFT